MKTRYCPNCGRSIPLDARLCPYCAKTIPMHDTQIVTGPEEKKDNAGKIILIIAVVIIVIIAVTIAIAATVYVYVSGMMGSSSHLDSTPTISFIKTDQSTTNTLTVASVDPSTVLWSDIGLKVDGISENHGLYGLISAGDKIDITEIAGTGAYEISLNHMSTESLIFRTDFIAN